MNIMQKIDQLLDSFTMYRLLHYLLIFFLVIGGILGFFKLAPYSPVEILISSLFLVAVCWATNKVISIILKAPTNPESTIITSLILSLIVSPAHTFHGFIFLAEVGILAMVSKYVLTINKKHIFNPTAIAVVITSVVFNQAASWWVGTTYMNPFILAGGVLLIRKLQLEKLVGSFLATSVGIFLIIALISNGDVVQGLQQLVLNSPLLFFAFIMLTEPQTLPPTRNLRVIYGVLIGILTVPQLHFGSFYFTPELALVTGNIFSFLVSSKRKLFLKLNEKKNISQNMLEFIFKPSKKLSYIPGQYMEWTIPHNKIDNRGNRRFFTLSSSPTEETIRLGVKFYENGSSFKNALKELNEKQIIVASGVSGDFTLPKNKNQKIVFIAGGIGITPYRSMIKYLLDKKEKRDIILLYSNTNENEIVYKDVFDQAKNELGIKAIYVLTEKTGRINKEMIIKEVPDYKERLFYISGSQPLVNGIKQTLKEIGVKWNKIKTDFFPGYA